MLSSDPDTTRRISRPERLQRPRPTTKTRHHKSTADAATHTTRVPSQRRHALAGRHVPDLDLTLVILVVRPRDDAPPVRKHGNAFDLRRSQIIPKVQWTPQRTPPECPLSVATHSPVATSQTLSVLSFDADKTRRPSGNTATLSTYDEDISSQKYSGRRNAPNPSALSASPRISTSPSPRSIGSAPLLLAVNFLDT